MPKQVEFFYDFTSPTAYLAWARLPAIAQRTGAKIIYRPMFLGGVMQTTGNRPPGTLPQGGETVVEFPNNHLGYAITWFGFALIAPILLVFWLRRTRRPRPS